MQTGCRCLALATKVARAGREHRNVRRAAAAAARRSARGDGFRGGFFGLGYELVFLSEFTCRSLGRIFSVHSVTSST